MVKARPFTKWVGGKAKLIPFIEPRLPRTFSCYHEPFVGGGAMFFHLQPQRAFLSDANPYLINTYIQVRDNVEELIGKLSELRYDRELYYSIRDRFNRGEGSTVERAAWFILINKTGFNGLWRVNQSGGCNVPFGDYTNPTICDAENLRACSEALQGASIHCGDFGRPHEAVETGDLIYFDSPYYKVSVTSDFTGYTADGFRDTDQRRLADLFRRLARQGVYCIASNSDTPFIRELYAGLPMYSASRSGAISCKAGGRGRVAELVICGWDWATEQPVAAE